MDVGGHKYTKPIQKRATFLRCNKLRERILNFTLKHQYFIMDEEQWQATSLVIIPRTTRVSTPLSITCLHLQLVIDRRSPKYRIELNVRNNKQASLYYLSKHLYSASLESVFVHTPRRIVAHTTWSLPNRKNVSWCLKLKPVDLYLHKLHIIFNL